MNRTVSTLHGQLERWVGEGLLAPDQATRIEAAEAARGTPPVPRSSLVVEALGYLGGLLAAIAGFLAVEQLWPGIPLAAELAFAAGGGVLLLLAGAAIRSGDPALRRLRSVLWLLSTGCVTAFAALLAGRVWDLADITTALLAAAVAAAYSAALWARGGEPLQHLATFAATAATVGLGIARIDTDLAPWSSGIGVWLLSASWGAAALRGRVRPPLPGAIAAAVGLLAGAVMTMGYAAGHVLAIATVAALLAGGVVLRQVWLLLIGAIGVLVVVPQTATRYLPDSLAAPLALFVTGLVLLTVAIRLARSRGHLGGTTAGSRSSGPAIRS